MIFSTMHSQSTKLHSFLVVPLLLSQWVPVRMGPLPFPSFVEKQSGWEIQTEASAGGQAYCIPPGRRLPLAHTQLQWEWKVDEFPVTSATSPLEKKSDDFALRVGLLLSGDGAVALPPDLAKLADKLSAEVSYVVFYATTNNEAWANRCTINPFSKRVLNCLVLAGPQLSKGRANPHTDVQTALGLPTEKISKLQAVGLWIFADSDNSKTKSKGFIKNIQLINKITGTKASVR
jgi:hypothetical protein